MKKNIPYAFILEDDASFDKNWIEKLDEFKYEDFNLVLLNAWTSSFPCYKWNLCFDQCLAGGYIISFNGCKILCELYKDCLDIADYMTMKLQNYGKCYTYFPWLIVQDNNDSQIGNNCKYDDEFANSQLSCIQYSRDNYI